MIFKRIRFYWNRFIDWCYFGKVTSKVKSWDGGCASEIEYRGRNNEVVGYWAYGNYDPIMPYPRRLQRPTTASTRPYGKLSKCYTDNAPSFWHRLKGCSTALCRLCTKEVQNDY